MNSIHPTAQLIGDVSLGEGNTIGPLAVIIGPVTIGNNNWFGTGALVGAPPEVRGWEHPRDAERPSSGNGILIGDRTTIREYVQIHQGWRGTTQIEDDVFMMNQCYVAHDCTVENGATLASSVLLAGHVRVGAGANLGLGASVHQRRYVGEGAMVGMGSVVTKDVPPFAKTYGNPAKIRGANLVGMERAGIAADIIAAIASVYDRKSLDELSVLDNSAGLERALASWKAFASA